MNKFDNWYMTGNQFNLEMGGGGVDASALKM